MISFTIYLWLNLILAGFFLGIGALLAIAIYHAVVWVVSIKRVV